MTTFNKQEIASLVSALVSRGGVSVTEWEGEGLPIPQFNATGRRIVAEAILSADPQLATDLLSNDGELITYLLHALNAPDSNTPAVLGNRVMNFITNELIDELTMWDMIEPALFQKELSGWVSEDFAAVQAEQFDNGYYWQRGQ